VTARLTRTTRYPPFGAAAGFCALVAWVTHIGPICRLCSGLC
jgi:hypothetical protein